MQRRPCAPLVRCHRWPQHPGQDATPAPPYPGSTGNCCCRSSKELVSANPSPGPYHRQTHWGAEIKAGRNPRGGQQRDAWGCTSLQGERARGKAAAVNMLQQLGSGARCAQAGIVLGENGPAGTCPREEGSVLLLPTSPPSAYCCARRRKPSPHPLCSRAVQKAAGSCRETACLACRREC